MKKLIYTTNCSDRIHFGIPLSKIREEIYNGNEVYWAYCHNALSSCEENKDGNKATCLFCHIMYKEILNKYKKNSHIVKIDSNKFLSKKIFFEYNDISDIKKITYRNVMVGMSILSSYLTYTRDLDCNITEGFRSFFDIQVNEQCAFIDYIYDLINEIKPDEISVFNGRFYENRAFYDISKALGIHFVSVGSIGDYADKYWEATRISRHNVLPQDLSFYTNMIERIWIETKTPEKDKVEIASNFYRKRRKGINAMDWKSYTSGQKKGLLPDNYDNNRRNFVIFNSSPDENAAVGGEWEEDLLFSSQFDAINFMLDNSPENVHFYLRIHPNMANARYRAHMDLYRLQDLFDNITIIPPTSKISSYTLMDVCEKTFTFGSTMGIEACYWGKPSILIGKAVYQNVGACYIPKSKEELIKMMVENLAPQSKIGAVKYAYSLYDKEVLADSKQFVDYNFEKKKILGKTMYVVPYQRFFNSSLLYILLQKLFGYFRKYSNHKFDYPWSF